MRPQACGVPELPAKQLQGICREFAAAIQRKERKSVLEVSHLQIYSSMEASNGGNVYDVIITSSTEDTELASRLQTQLKDASVTVTLSTDEVTHNQKKMINAKVLVFIASKHSICDEVCNDWLSLANLTNKHITVVSTEEKDELLQQCEAGMKSSFKTLNWTVLDCGDKLDSVVKTVQDIISGSVADKPCSRSASRRFKSSTRKAWQNPAKRGGDYKDQNITQSDFMDGPNPIPLNETDGAPCTEVSEQRSIQMREVVTDIIETASKWRELGVQLCVPKDKLHSIHRPDSAVAQQCLSSVIEYWIDNIATDDMVEDKQTLIAALSSPALGSNDLANELCKESFDLSNAELVCKLSSVASQWYAFGNQLGIPTWKLDSFYPCQSLKAHNSQYLMNMLDIWRKGVYSPPAQLITALRTIGMRKLATRLAPKYEGIQEVVD